MSQIHFITPEQEAQIPEYQAKWRNIYLSTEPIDRDRASAAVRQVYAVMGKTEPEIIFCSSPRAALERLQTYVDRIETPQPTTSQSPEEILQGLNFAKFAKFFVNAAWQGVKLRNKQKKSGIRAIANLIKQLSEKPSQALAKHINSLIPKDITTQEIVEQSFLGTSPLFELLAKQQKHQGKPDLEQILQEKQSEDEEWQESFRLSASNTEQQLSWLPGKKFFFRQWLKRMLQGTVTSQITGLEHPGFRDAFYQSHVLSIGERRFLTVNPPVIMPELALSCTWLDFAFSVLNYPCNARYWSALQDLVQNCGGIFTFGNFCLICDRPEKILLDKDNQLHSEGEAALQYRDGYAAYAYHGITLPEKYGAVAPEEWQAQWVLEEQNRQFKQILVRVIGAVRLYAELPLIELATRGEYTFFRLDENTGTRAIYLLKRTNEETGEIKAVSLPWQESTLDRAIQYANKYYSAEDFPLLNEE